MGVVDFHSHFFGHTFFATLARLSPQPGDVGEKLARLAQRTGIELPAEDPVQHQVRWAAELDTAGVEHLVTFASVPPEVPDLARACAASAGRMTPMALVDPTAEGAGARVAELLDAHGFRGVLTFPAQHRFHPGEARVRPVLEALAARRGVCYVHCGILVVKLKDLLGIPRDVDLAFANPLGIVPAANAFPEVTFVVPHFGAGFLRETLMLGAQCENVVVDSSSSNGWLRTQPVPMTLKDVFARALDVFGPRRVLFGTDSGPFPAGWRKDRLQEQAEILWDLGLTGEERDAVLGGNARRVLGLKGA